MRRVMISFLELEEISSKILIGDVIRKFNHERKDQRLKAIYALIYVYCSISFRRGNSILLPKQLYLSTLKIIYGNYSLDIDFIGFVKVETKEMLLAWLSNNMIGKLITVKKYGRNKIFDL